MEILRLDGLCKQYPAFRLDNVSFSMEAGTIMGLIGRNGAGKTTTLKSMLHLVHPDAGKITICGLDMDTDERAIHGLEGWIACYEKCRLAGTVFAGGVTEPGAIAGPPALETARAMGAAIA